MTLIDDLTGLPNRRLLSDRLSQSITKAQRDQSLFALLHIDLDAFKLVNDRIGHDAGGADHLGEGGAHAQHHEGGGAHRE